MSVSLLYKQDKSPAILPIILKERGWSEFEEQKHDSAEWSLLWKTGRPKPSEYANGLEYQRINHFPKTSLICTKDNLARGLRKMKGIYGSVYHFFPQTFILPSEYNKLVEECLKQETVWICKPADLSRGRKIYLFKDIRDLQYDQAVIVQRYMRNPLLIGQYKWDMRVYVLVTSFHPLTVYVYREGLTRFGTDTFDLSDLNNKYSHLTNFSINKFSIAHNISKDVVGAGSKWTFRQLNGYLQSIGMNVEELWKEIKKIAVLTLVMIAPEVPE